MSNHTPGPWQAVGTKVFGLDAVVAIEQDHPRHFICSIPRVKPTASPPANPDQEANARLIAAAPDLLAACQKMLNAYFEYTARYTNNDLSCSIISAAGTIRDAIAKAGDSVTILCDNPDFNGQPNNAVECCGDWTGWESKRFTGDSLGAALSAAVRDRD